MTGRQILLKALEECEVERGPWVPFSGVHSTGLIGTDATTSLVPGPMGEFMGAHLKSRRLRPPARGGRGGDGR